MCILRHVLGHLRIILYRRTRDRLICNRTVGKGGVQWAEQDTPIP